MDSNMTGTASVKTMEFIPVKEKVKLIAAQQEELNRRDELSATQVSENVKHKGVRILPPSPVTVRKMSVEEELHHYDCVVSRTTPVTQLMEMAENPLVPGETDHSEEKTYSQTIAQASSVSSSSFSHQAGAAQELAIPAWSQQGQKNKENLMDQTFDQLIAETEQVAYNDDILFSQLQTAAVSQSFQSTQMTSTSFS